MARRRLTQRERELDRDEDRDRLAHARAGGEAPLFGGFDRFLIETERGIGRADDLRVAHGAVGPYHALEDDDALHFGAHGVGRVVRANFLQHARQRDAVAGTINAAAGAAAAALTKSGPRAGTNARSSSRARAATRARSLRDRRWTGRHFNRTGQRFLRGREALRRNVQLLGRRLVLRDLLFELRRLFLDRH